MTLKRIIIHWTAGSHTPNQTDLKAYHYVIDGKGGVHAGKFTPEDNLSTGDGKYAAHTLNCNTGSIGVSLAAMAGAVERPFNSGKFPITAAQEKALTDLLVMLSKQHGIPVSRETILTHAEVQPTLGIAQKNKWDITWLPGMTQPGNPIAIGDLLRERVRVASNMKKPHNAPETGNPASKPGIIHAILSFLSKLLGGRK